MNSLTQTLFDEYGGFADKRIRSFEKGDTFAVDDRDHSDIGADRRPLSHFCVITATISRPRALAPEELTVSLSGNVPDSAGVQSWIQRQSVEHPRRTDKTLTFPVDPGEESKLRELARLIRIIVAPGAPRYSIPSYKYACPRTAGSLERLADVLEKKWSI